MPGYPEATKLWLEQQLEDTWATVVDERGVHSRDEQEHLLLDMRQWCTTKLAHIASRRNACTSPARSRIPPEVWSMIWRLLRSNDIHDVARVCHSWRKTALSDKLLWTSPSIHIRYREPACPPDACYIYCMPPFSFEVQPGDKEHDASRYDNSALYLYEPLAILRNFAERSGDLPLTVRIIVGHETPHKKVAPSLAIAMGVFKARIRSLHFVFDSMDALKDTLWRLDDIRLALPALDRLTLDCSQDDCTVPICTLPFPKMPVLCTLEILTDALEWSGYGGAANLATVEHLTTSLNERLDNLPLVQRICPNLTSVTARLYCGPDKYLQHVWDNAVRWYGGLREIRIDFDEGWAQHLARLLAACHGVQYLELKQKPGDPTWTAEEASLGLFSIEQLFHEESTIDLLHWTISKAQLSILARHSSGRTRRLVVGEGQHFAAELAERAWMFAGRAREIRVLRVQGIEREVHRFIRTGSQHILKTVREIRRRDEWSVLGEELHTWLTSVAAAEDTESESEEEADSE